MDPVSLIPPPDTLPAHWLILQTLLTSTTFLHFMAMNVMLGAGLIIWLAPFCSANPAPMRRDIARLLPYTIAFTINFGVAPLLFLQVLYGQFLYTSNVLMATFWLAIVGLLILTYYLTYLYKYNYEQEDLGPFFIGGAILLLLAIAFLFANSISLMQDPAAWPRYFAERGGTILNLADAALLPRYLHFILSALAVGGLAIALYYKLTAKDGGDGSQTWIRYGCNCFSIATILNFGVGFWFLGRLPTEIYTAESPQGTFFYILLLISVAAICLAVVSAQRARVITATVWTLITVLMMTIMRDVVRVGYLDHYLDLAAQPLKWQWLPMFLFIILFGGTIYLSVWMIKLVLNDKREVN